MEKQELLSQVIKSFKANSPELPQDLSALLWKIEQRIEHSSETEILKETSQVETLPSTELSFENDELNTLLYDAFPLMQSIAKQATENQYELWQAVNVLRGKLGMATDLPVDLA